MKLAATIALGLAITTASAVNAQTPVSTSAPTAQPVPTASASVNQTYSAPSYNRRARNYSAPSRSFFGQLMELERRKNAWLRRTFLGR